MDVVVVSTRWERSARQDLADRLAEVLFGAGDSESDADADE